MILPAFLLTCFALTASAGHLSFRASPRFAVESVTPSLTLTCRLPVAPDNVYMMVMMDMQHTDVNGTVSHIARIDGQNGLQITAAANRTSAEGNVDDEDAPYYLAVTVAEPIEEDSGEYECKLIYISKEANAFSLTAYENVTVTGEPIEDFVMPPAPVTCECDRIWEEIDNIKATLAARPTSSGATGNVSSECQASFSAYFSSLTNVPIVNDETIVFDATRANVGGAYSTDTGEFTAPCDGQYYFNVALRSYTDLDAGYVDGVLTAGGLQVARTSVFVHSPVSNIELASTGSVVSLKQGEKVKVVALTTSTGSFKGQEYSIFSGFYVSP